MSSCEPPGDGDFLDLGEDRGGYNALTSLFILLECLLSNDDDLGGGGWVG